MTCDQELALMWGCLVTFAVFVAGVGVGKFITEMRNE